MVVSAVGLVLGVVGIVCATPFIGQVALMWGLGAAGASAVIASAFQYLRQQQQPLLVRGRLEPAQFDISFALGERIYKKRLKNCIPQESKRTAG